MKFLKKYLIKISKRQKNSKIAIKFSQSDIK